MGRKNIKDFNNQSIKINVNTITDIMKVLLLLLFPHSLYGPLVLAHKAAKLSKHYN